jgi:26S proteasome non-ATPase regulatory subunit 10
MIAVSLKEGEDLVKLFLQKGADVNAKSRFLPFDPNAHMLTLLPDFSGQVRPTSLTHPSSITLHTTFLTPTQTALHFVASKAHLDIARKLLDAKPPASTRVKDKRGQYPIHRAAAVGSVPMVELFVKHRSPINAADNEGQTPLHHAVAEGHGTFRPFSCELCLGFERGGEGVMGQGQRNDGKELMR